MGGSSEAGYNDRTLPWNRMRATNA
jgi:hypothetical protein